MTHGDINDIASWALQRAMAATQAAGDALRPHAHLLLFGEPTVPQPFKLSAATSTDFALIGRAAMVFLNAVRAPIQPGAAALVGLQVALTAWPKGHRPSQVGLNPERVLMGGEWHRLVSASLVHRAWPELAAAAATTYEEASRLERRYGSRTAAAVVASLHILSSGLYMLGAWAATKIAPSSALASAWSDNHLAGIIPTLVALMVFNGYDEDVEAGSAEAPVSSARFQWLPFTVAGTVLNQSPPALVCGAAAGLGAVYARGAKRPAWAAAARLGRQDLLIQGGAAVAVVAAAAAVAACWKR